MLLKKNILYILIISFFLLHLIYLNTPFVNLEWVYKIGTDYFINLNPNDLSKYFSNQANPITYSFFSSFLVYVFGENFISYRLLALLGGTIILLCFVKYRSPFLILMIGLNPLIWVYSGRAYSELFSVGLMILAIEIEKKAYFGGLIGVISASVKYHSILFLGPYWAFKWLETLFEKKKFEINDLYLKSSIVLVLGFLFFLFLYFYVFDIWIIPDKWKNDLALFIPDLFNNFFSYGFYLSALFCITAPYFLFNSKLKSHLIAISISIPLAILNQDNGEMNFGSLDQLIGSELILLIKIIGFWNFILCSELFLKNKENRILCLTILIFILLLSTTRPAQRYLIYIIPFWALMIHQSRIHIHVFYKWGYIFALLIVNIFVTLYQVSNAKASENIIFWAKENNLSINTNVIYPHVGYASNHSWDSDLVVRLHKDINDQIIYESPVSVLNYEIRKYIVVKETKN